MVFMSPTKHSKCTKQMLQTLKWFYEWSELGQNYRKEEARALSGSLSCPRLQSQQWLLMNDRAVTPDFKFSFPLPITCSVPQVSILPRCGGRHLPMGICALIHGLVPSRRTEFSSQSVPSYSTPSELRALCKGMGAPHGSVSKGCLCLYTGHLTQLLRSISMSQT
jgi:hypothetical protein